MRNFYHRILLGNGEGLNLELYTGLKIFPNQGEQVLSAPLLPWEGAGELAEAKQPPGRKSPKGTLDSFLLKIL